jgi:hypothetical protein
MELMELINIEDVAQNAHSQCRESLRDKDLSYEHVLLVDLRLLQILTEGIMKRASDALQTAAPHVPPPAEF